PSGIAMMGTDYPSEANRIDALLVAWHEELAASGRVLSAAELCRGCPELAAEVEQRLRGLRRSEGLLGTPDGDPAQTANRGPPPDRTEPLAERGDTAVPAIPGYEILGKVGEGGMGLVYRARHVTLNRVEAVKVVRTAEFAGPRQLARFRFEA